MSGLSTIDLNIAAIGRGEHARGPASGGITLLQYGDYQCLATREAAAFVKRLERQWAGRLRYVFRHFPQDTVHPQSWIAAEAAEAAAAQGKFWEMHALLLDRQHALYEDDLHQYARELRLDADRFALDLATSRHAGLIYAAQKSAQAAGIDRTPTFFINGRRQDGPGNYVTLSAAIEHEWFGRRPTPTPRPAAREEFRASPALIREIHRMVG
ncbi:MAG TPA: thioredoxin domain-containing protein [Humisphaera sp.]|jgi:protein-disulfide isomerase|nr:thioredoxin domain-containing protein [Humisphaera sp.]